MNDNQQHDLALWDTYLARVRTHTDTIRKSVELIYSASKSLGLRYPWALTPVDIDLASARNELAKLVADIDDTIHAIERAKEIKAAADKSLAVWDHEEAAE